ncbi:MULTISPECIES: hypothetical protein [Synechococcales]|nr:hypothetical protein [Synechococcus sp. CS-1333]MCT0211042.1 hypothetical protein [Synechococcus sp. CS-1333]
MSTRSGWQHRFIVPQFTLVTGMLMVAVGTVVMASPFCSNDDVCWWG